jgi:hypothetical protein
MNWKKPTATATAAATPPQQKEEAPSFLDERKQVSQKKGTTTCSTTITHLSVSMENTTFSSTKFQTSNASYYCHKAR